MSAEPQKSKQESAPERLPFEPGASKKKAAKLSEARATSENQSQPEKADRSASAKPGGMGVPEVVSQRMARRMAFFSGVPTLLGMATFVGSYLLVIQLHYKIPNTAVLLVSLGFFGLGVLGLSYGLFSASWDENRVGSLLGIDEFGTNTGRLIQAWKEARAQQLKSRPSKDR
ncbi:PAM68 family protein [Alkalinema pantanalense CENA528]|uniref:PAM68 family protein n=1 Tax=Alkalinema pantanalense TaxID=1620705 RepID=UPI003D6F786D